MQTEYKYFAFISYNSRDVSWGKRLQRKLEQYRMPATLCSERGWERKPLKPIFFAPTDIQMGDLSEELKSRLSASCHLIVICSPNAAQSEWVGREISYFHSLGRSKNIHFFIVEGTPNSSNPREECFNPVIKELGLDGVLGANVNEKNYALKRLNHERAYVQLITTLLNVEFDSIWQRHRRLLIRRAITTLCTIIVVIAAIVWAWSINRPTDVTLHLSETTAANDSLPPLSNGVVTLYLDNDVITKSIADGSNEILFPNIPHNKLGSEVRITLNGDNYYPAEATLTLDEQMTLNITRDTLLYGDVCFRLRDAQTTKPVAGCRVEIEGITATSDSVGMVRLYIPVAQQRKTYDIVAEREIEDATLTMPTGDGVVKFCK